MTEKTYLLDGKRYTAKDALQLLKGGSLSRREALVLSMIDNPKDDKVIADLGFLYGHFPKKLTEAFPYTTIIGGDYIEEHLEIARLCYPEISDVFRVLNVYDLDLDDHSVDVVTFQEVIEQLEGAAHAIKEINRVLKIGGQLILSTPTAYYWRDMWQAFKYESIRKFRKKKRPLSENIYFSEHEWNRHIYCGTPCTLYTLLKVNGFEYVTHDYCKEGRGFFERSLLKLFPFLSITIVMKVVKVCNAPAKIV